MSSTERWGSSRDLTYSNWHREASMARFLNGRASWALGLIDIDGLEYCRSCETPLALIETTRYQGSYRKSDYLTLRLAVRADVPMFTVFYESERPQSCPHCGRYGPPWPDPSAFHVMGPRPARDVSVMDPAEYALWLLDLRLTHRRTCEKGWGSEWKGMGAAR
jgi:hypothetical protein